MISYREGTVTNKLSKALATASALAIVLTGCGSTAPQDPFEHYKSDGQKYGVVTDTQKYEFDSVSQNLCDNSASEYEYLVDVLSILDNDEVWVEKAILIHIACPGDADLWQGIVFEMTGFLVPDIQD